MDIYQEQIRDIFGTTDLNQLRQYAAQLKSVPCTQKIHAMREGNLVYLKTR